MDKITDLEAVIHETARKYVEEESTRVEALCLAYLVHIGKELITDWCIVRQQSDDRLTVKIWLQRKDDPIISPLLPATGLVELYGKE